MKSLFLMVIFFLRLSMMVSICIVLVMSIGVFILKRFFLMFMVLFMFLRLMFFRIFLRWRCVSCQKCWSGLRMSRVILLFVSVFIVIWLRVLIVELSGGICLLLVLLLVRVFFRFGGLGDFLRLSGLFKEEVKFWGLYCLNKCIYIFLLYGLFIFWVQDLVVWNMKVDLGVILFLGFMKYSNGLM